jgi:sigma-B regulation protein RsbU (phosphoserine phosphatase)
VNADLIRRWLQLGQLMAGVLTLTAGVAQLGFSRPFRQDRNRPLAFLGITGLLYGTRLLANLPQIQELIPAPPLFWLYIDTWVSYLILVPTLYFIELSFGGGWHQSIRWMRRIATLYAVAAMAIDAVTATPAAAKGPLNYLIIAAIGVVIASSFGTRATPFQGLRVVRAGALVFGAFVLFENIVRARGLPGTWTVEWAGVLVMLGCLGYVAVSRAVENDRRLHELKHELETARQIQASILPRQIPVIEGLAIAARLLPMTEVAGDFYDFLELGAGRIGILAADVSGHGVPAALIASMVKVALGAQAGHGDNPASVLNGMNQIFCGRLESQFVTAAYVYFDTADGRLRYGAAGHPPALLVRANGEVDDLVENGVMLGHFPDWRYTWVERPFRPGDRLILYTDGLIEVSDARGDFFDAERLRAFARDGRARDAGAFIDALVGHVSSWAGHAGAPRFDDDVTVVVVDRLPLP